LAWSSALNSMVASGAAATQRRCAYTSSHLRNTTVAEPRNGAV
jgi:hypothetical protein